MNSFHDRLFEYFPEIFISIMLVGFFLFVGLVIVVDDDADEICNKHEAIEYVWRGFAANEGVILPDFEIEECE